MKSRSAPSRLIAISCLLVSVGLGKTWGQQLRVPTVATSFAVLTRVSDIHALAEKEAGGENPDINVFGRAPVPVPQRPRYEKFALGPRNVLLLMGALVLASAGWVIFLRRQVREKTREIREWLRREAALKDRYRDLLENAIDMVYTHDLQGDFTSVNNTTVRVMGYTRPEMLRMNFAQVVATEYRDLVRQAVDGAAKGEACRDFELEVVTKNGARLAVEVRSRLLYEDGKVVGVQGIARNVTERKRVEQQVRLQAAALEAAALGIGITNREGNFLWVNPAFTALSGYTLEEVVGKSPRVLKSGTHDGEFYRNMWSTILSGRVWRGEVVDRRKDGTFFSGDLTITPVRGTSGETTHFVAIGQDISARKQAEETRAQLAAIVESSNDAISGISSQGTIVSWNRGAEVLYGYRPEEILGKPVSILAPPELSHELCHLVEQVHRGERISNFETVRMGKDGRRVDVSLSMSPLKNGCGEMVGSAAIARDITQRRQAEEALHQSEEKYRSIVLNIPDVVWAVDSRGRIVFVSPNVERLGGYTAEEVLQGGLDLLLETMHPEDVPTMKETLQAAFRDHQPREVEYRGRCKDGRWIWVRARAIGSFEKDGVQCLQGLLSDITERKQAEEELYESQARLQAIVDSVQTGIVIIDPETHRIVDANPVALELIGGPRSQMVGAECHKFICPADRGRCPVSDLGQKVDNSERVLLTASGDRRDIIKTVVRVVIGGRQHLLESFVDITERKRAEKALRESEQFNREVIASAQEGVVVYDRELRYQVWNRFMEELTGVPASETLGKHGLEFFPHLREQSVDLIIHRALGGEVVHAPDLPFRVPATGKSGWVSIVFGPHLGSSGEILGVIGIIGDITERKHTEGALRESEAGLAAAQRIAHIGSWEWNIQTNTAHWSDETFRIFGLTPGQLVDHRQAFLQLIHPADRVRVDHALTEGLDGTRKYDIEYRIQLAEGTEKAIHAQAEVLKDVAGKPLGMRGIIHDITERKRAQEMLQESEERFRQLAENVEEVLLLFDPQVNEVFYVSPAYEKVWGRSCKSLYESPRSFLAGIHPDDRPVIAASLELSNRNRGEWEYRVIRPNGTLRWVWDRAFPIRDSAGRVVRVAELVQDITERKQVEVATHQAMKAAEDANRTKSEFLANMSHELRTPMNGVIGMTELALATDLDPEQRDYLEMVESSADSLLELINHLLDFSNIEAGKLELEVIPFILADVVEEALRPLAIQAYRKGLEMAWALESTIPSPLLGDPVRLKQLMVSLVENAIKFTERGEVVVRAWVESQLGKDIVLHISVADTGVGVPDDKIAMIFEAFTQADGSSTRRFEGAGLGLAICSELARMMGGSIEVESGSGQGSTFHVTVRLSLAASAGSPQNEGENSLLRNATVLMVDDHAATREIVADMLRYRGMVPTVVEGAEAALTAIREAQNSAAPFLLALFDAQMPNGDGFGLAEQARRIPGFSAPILMMLPPTDVGRDLTRCRELGIVDYCPKPVRELDLVKSMVKALEVSLAGNVCPHTAGSPKELGRGLRILLAESNELTQVLVTHLLEKQGHQVFAAVDGLEALGAIQDAHSQDFDLILMDTEMPRMSGLEVARAIREIERNTGGRLPIIAMTALPAPGEEEACVAAGMDACLAKPLRPSALFEVIRRVVAPPDFAARGENPLPRVFDKSAFLSRLEGDEQLGSEIIEMFLQEYPKLMEGVRQAAEQRNASLLERAAHTLKGSVGDISAPQAFAAALTLEHMGRQGDLEGLDAAVMNLEVALQRLAPELHNPAIHIHP